MSSGERLHSVMTKPDPPDLKKLCVVYQIKIVNIGSACPEGS